MFVSAIIAAGGRGLRLGGAIPKQLMTVAGRPILERSVAAFLAHPQVGKSLWRCRRISPRIRRHISRNTPKRLRIVVGGERRQDSVSNAFQAIDAQADLVVIHDAARPFATADLISRTIDAAARSGAALAALPARDTVKRTDVSASRRRPDRAIRQRDAVAWGNLSRADAAGVST